MDETKIAPLTSLAEGPPQLTHESPIPQPRQPVPHAQRNVHRLAALKTLAPLLSLADPA
jgi:hypothetical protein